MKNLIFSFVIAISVFESIRANEFMDETRKIIFEEIFVVPRSCEEILRNDDDYVDLKADKFADLVSSTCKVKVNDSYLGDLSDNQCSDLCDAVLKRNPGPLTFKTLNDKVEQAKLYEIEYPVKGRTGRVAIQCSTSPSLYVLFQNPRENKNIVMMAVGKRWT